jgi:hypothetical protein
LSVCSPFDPTFEREFSDRPESADLASICAGALQLVFEYLRVVGGSFISRYLPSRQSVFEDSADGFSDDNFGDDMASHHYR